MRAMRYMLFSAHAHMKYVNLVNVTEQMLSLSLICTTVVAKYTARNMQIKPISKNYKYFPKN